MQAKTVGEVRELAATQAMQDWWTEYAELARKLKESRPRDGDAVMDAAFLAGEYEERAAHAHHEFERLDSSFEELSDYETQRQASTEAWVACERAQHLLEDARQQASEAHAELTALKKNAQADVAEVKRLESEVKLADGRVEKCDREAIAAKKNLENEEAKKGKLWQVVESMWTDTFRANMESAEYTYHAKRLSGEVERASKADADSQPGSGEGYEHALKTWKDHLAKAESEFGCIAVESFLYWPMKGEIALAICLPLTQDHDHLNVQVSPLKVYRMERAKGLRFIEPVPEEEIADEDPRLEAFFAPA